MEVSSVQQLCKHLIFCAVQRCRLSDEICRLSIVFKPDLQSIPLVRISVSDTGSGCQLEDFHYLSLSANPVLSGKWDGVILVTTTSISDNEIHHFSLNLKEKVTAKRFSKINSISKYSAKFSGTEVSFTIFDDVNYLLPEITLFVQKMSILKIPAPNQYFRNKLTLFQTKMKVAVELLVDNQSILGLQSKNHVLAVECCPLYSSTTNVERLKSGLEGHVLKHENKLNSTCHSCFPTMDNLKIGTGIATRSGLQTMEAVVIINEVSETLSSSCCNACSNNVTQVLFLKDFTPYAITKSAVDAFSNIKWKDYGLTLKSISEVDGCAFLEWESLPPSLRIFIALHCYHEKVRTISAVAGNHHLDLTLTKKALNSALKELKEKNSGTLLSVHALKIQDYAPDLAKTIAGLISSSNDAYFKEECFSLLGLQSQNAEEIVIENCLKDRIISVIGLNDRKQTRNREREPAAALLFEDYAYKPDFLEEEEVHEEYHDDFFEFDLRDDFDA